MSDHHYNVCDDEDRIGIEYWYGSPERYDGVSEWSCKHGRFGRWCGQKLRDNEIERRFCDGSQAHPKIEVGEEQ